MRKAVMVLESSWHRLGARTGTTDRGGDTPGRPRVIAYGSKATGARRDR
jgi:hypothetical protein